MYQSINLNNDGSIIVGSNNGATNIFNNSILSVIDSSIIFSNIYIGLNKSIVIGVSGFTSGLIKIYLFDGTKWISQNVGTDLSSRIFWTFSINGNESRIVLVDKTSGLYVINYDHINGIYTGITTINNKSYNNAAISNNSMLIVALGTTMDIYKYDFPSSMYVLYQSIPNPNSTQYFNCKISSDNQRIVANAGSYFSFSNYLYIYEATSPSSNYILIQTYSDSFLPALSTNKNASRIYMANMINNIGIL
jgi:hypothetical protein